MSNLGILGIAKGILAVLVLGAIGFGVFSFLPVTINVNGEEHSVSRASTYQVLIDQDMIPERYSNLVAVDGSVLEEGKGNPPKVFVDGEEVGFDERVSTEGEITAAPADDAIEPYQATEERTPSETLVARDHKHESEQFNFYNGILHLVTREGADGIVENRTGEISGKTARVEVQAMQPRAIENIYTDLPDSEKVIALTFDDGPNNDPTGTPAVLDALAKHQAKGTFFMLGTAVENNPDMAKKVADAGHQVASHTYSHDPADSLDRTTPEGAREQVEHARSVIASAVGYEPTLVRPTGGNVNTKAIKAIGTLADGYIGWNLDTFDYERPGAKQIAQTMIDQAVPGAVVLMHDGGGDRSQTAQALDIAIPKLQQQGYRFVTIDELIDIVLANRSQAQAEQQSDQGSADNADEESAQSEENTQ